jgi:hypothetical protein
MANRIYPFTLRLESVLPRSIRSENYHFHSALGMLMPLREPCIEASTADDSRVVPTVCSIEFVKSKLKADNLFGSAANRESVTE